MFDHSPVELLNQLELDNSLTVLDVLITIA